MTKPSLKLVAGRGPSVHAAPSAPNHLSKAAREEWAQFQRDYGIVDPAGLRLISMMCEANDEIKEAQRLIKKHGQLVIDKAGVPHKNPACLTLERARSCVLRCIKQLDINTGNDP